jgi:hypothetical protein
MMFGKMTRSQVCEGWSSAFGEDRDRISSSRGAAACTHHAPMLLPDGPIHRPSAIPETQRFIFTDTNQIENPLINNLPSPLQTLQNKPRYPPRPPGAAGS